MNFPYISPEKPLLRSKPGPARVRLPCPTRSGLSRAGRERKFHTRPTTKEQHEKTASPRRNDGARSLRFDRSGRRHLHGTLGKSISLAFLVIGLSLGIIRGSIVAAVTCIAASLSLMIAPTILEAIFTVSGT